MRIIKLRKINSWIWFPLIWPHQPSKCSCYATLLTSFTWSSTVIREFSLYQEAASLYKQTAWLTFLVHELLLENFQVPAVFSLSLQTPYQLLKRVKFSGPINWFYSGEATSNAALPQILKHSRSIRYQVPTSKMDDLNHTGSCILNRGWNMIMN